MGLDSESFSHLTILNAEDLALIRKAKDVLLDSLEAIFSEGWKMESKGDTDIVESKVINGVKVFRMLAIIDAPADRLMKILFDEFSTQTTWNSGVLEARILKTLDQHTDIAYTVSVAKGPVKSRDFVILRHRAAVGTSLVISSVSIESVLMPPDKYIRGENGAGCFVITPTPSDSEVSELRWLVNTNLKGWIPQKVVDSAFTSFIHSYLAEMRALLAKGPKLKHDSFAVKDMPNLSKMDLPASIHENVIVKSSLDTAKSKSQLGMDDPSISGEARSPSERPSVSANKNVKIRVVTQPPSKK